MHPLDEEVYEAIVEYKKTHDGVPPTRGELAEILTVSSKSLVQASIKRLVQAGMLREIPGKAAGVMVVGAHWTPPPERRPAYTVEPKVKF